MVAATFMVVTSPATAKGGGAKADFRSPAFKIASHLARVSERLTSVSAFDPIGTQLASQARATYRDAVAAFEKMDYRAADQLLAASDDLLEAAAPAATPPRPHRKRSGPRPFLVTPSAPAVPVSVEPDRQAAAIFALDRADTALSVIANAYEVTSPVTKMLVEIAQVLYANSRRDASLGKFADALTGAERAELVARATTHLAFAVEGKRRPAKHAGKAERPE